MLNTIRYETELFFKVFTGLETARRKKLEHYVKDVVNKKQIFFPGGTRFPPNFLLKKSFHIARIIEQLTRHPFFREGFVALLADGAESDLKRSEEALADDAGFSRLLETIGPDKTQSLVTLTSALLLTETLSEERARQILERLDPALIKEETPKADPDVAAPEPIPAETDAPLRHLIETLRDVKNTAPDESEKDESPAKIERPVAQPAALAETSAPRTEALRPALPRGPVKRFFDQEKTPLPYIPEPGASLHRYLVYLRRTGSFTNAHMAAERIEGHWLSNPEEYKHLFQIFGAVNLFSTSRINLPDGAFFVIDIDPHALEPNYDAVTRERRTDYCDRVDYNLLKREGRFFDASAFGLYPVVYVDDRLGDEPDFERNIYVRFSRNAETDERNFHLTAVPVLLSWGKYLYGPVTVKEDAQSRAYVNFQSATLKGLLPGFRRQERAFLEVTQFCKNEGKNTDSFFHPVTLVETSQLTPVLCDVMSDSGLMAKLVSSATSDRDSRETLQNWLETNRASSELFTADAAVRESRYNRIVGILSSADTDARFFDHIAALVSDTLNRSGPQGELFTKVVERISETPELMRRLHSHRVIAAKLRELTERRDSLEKDIRTMDEQAKKAAEDFRKEERQKNKALIDENARLESTLNERRRAIDFIDTNTDLLTLRETLNGDINTLTEQKNALEQQIDSLGEQLKNVAGSASQYAFDGPVASKLLEAAAAYAGSSRQKSCLDRVEAVRHLRLSELARGALADYLVRSVQQYREYDRNEILNLFICLTQSFLTVFSGGPGSGKTSICNIIGQVLGLSNVGEHVREGLWEEKSDANRYLPISVERGWTSKRDFVGYFNPLTKSFESVDDRRYDAFRQLDQEERSGVSALPFVMMLDEANLSPMEYYWADFMNICDRRSELSYISLGDKAHYHVPDTLRFLATINNDHTTEILSPRLIDRAMVITLPDVDWGALPARKPVTAFDPKLISWQALQELFGPRDIKAHKTDIADLLDELYDRMARAGFPVSARARLTIEHYISAAAAVFADDQQPAYVVAVDYALAQKLLPKLSGTGEEFCQWLEALKTFCESNGLDLSLKLIDQMIRRGKASMGYYKFF